MRFRKKALHNGYIISKNIQNASTSDCPKVQLGRVFKVSSSLSTFVLVSPCQTTQNRREGLAGGGGRVQTWITAANTGRVSRKSGSGVGGYGATQIRGYKI